MIKITWCYLILVHLHTCHPAHLLFFLRKQLSNNHTDFRESSSKRKVAPHGDNWEYHIGYKGDSKDYKLAEGHTEILGTHTMNPHLTNHLAKSPTFLVATESLPASVSLPHDELPFWRPWWNYTLRCGPDTGINSWRAMICVRTAAKLHDNSSPHLWPNPGANLQLSHISTVLSSFNRGGRAERKLDTTKGK